MQVEVLTLFPGVFASPLQESLLRRAQEKGLLCVRVRNLRDWAEGRHRIADDVPYGGGAGMVLKPEPIFQALESLRATGDPLRVILLTPQGERFTQETARRLAAETRRIVLLCGRYEGIDERVRLGAVDEEISIGDYVLAGGELAALVVIEAMARLLPGALGAEASAREDSFWEGLLDYPHYTRPAMFRGMEVPEVLLSGHHEQIRRWRRKEALRRTRARRPDLLARAPLSPEDRELLREIEQET
ncbi:MAG: tRNA (guanosine(37)-N1)-methyltransferase TrmD [Nitrospirae bacterium]|nr:tRNA (guanosine(37)-N1)-methyltransferase TrmD [Nitrospirota bacterium]